MLSTGLSMTEIAEKLHVDVSTVSRDIKQMRLQARAKHGEYIDNLPFEHTLSIASINKAHNELWALYRQTSDSRLKRAILDSIGDMVVKRQILLGDPEHINKALKAVAQIKKAVENAKKRPKESKSGNSSEPEEEELDDDPVAGIEIKEDEA